MKQYDPKKIEKKWQKYWEDNQTFKAADTSEKPKKYVLAEFPYPSGEGLHMGHLRPYVAGDVYSRYWRLRGYDVMYPMGWDAFGLPAENFAIKRGLHPRVSTAENVANAKRQTQSWGLGFDWSREVNSTDPEYYKWTQWIFLQLYKAGLAYEATGLINWCPKDKTGLANEEVIDGKCDRCGTPVEKKELRQWYLKITAYAEKLLEGLKNLPEWPEPVKLQQANWIGKSVGAEIDFEIKQEKVSRVVILHGRSGSAQKNSIPWLKLELEKRGFEVEAPDLPNSANPDDNEQADFVQKHCTLDENTIIVGTSFGGMVAMRLLERGIKVNKVVLAATPISGKFLDSKDRPSVVAAIKRGFNFDTIKSNAETFVVVVDTKDYAVPPSDGKILTEKFNASFISGEASKGHFCGRQEPLILSAIVAPDSSSITVFTTRPDTIFGATYLVVAPEHPLLINLSDKISNWPKVNAYIEKTKNELEQDRLAEDKDHKTGIDLQGVVAINPATGKEIPIWTADYVLGNYGTGAIMAVPAHDARDFEFAKKFGFPITVVVKSESDFSGMNQEKLAKFTKELFELANKEHFTLVLVGGMARSSHAKGKFGRHSDADLFVTKQGFEIIENYLNNKGFNSKTQPENETDGSHEWKNHKWFWKEGSGVWLDLFLLEEENDVYFDTVSGDKFIWGQKNVLETKRIEGSDFIVPSQDLTEAISQNLSKSWKECFTGAGVLVNSGEFSGLESSVALPKMAEKYGKLAVKYKLRDWVFSRQRYWGEPIPLTHCPACGVVPVPDDQLPVLLPEVEKYEPTGTGESPLAGIDEWVNTTCPNCGGPAKRETNTMPQWAGSSWYYLRYADPKNDKEFANPKLLKKWLPVDVYFGGMEHTTLHLLYSRFWHLALYDQKLVPVREPYTKRVPHGIILAADGEKMSKSRGNVVNPDDIVNEYGADTLRVYELFLGPHEATVAWNDKGIVGVRRFYERIWKWVNEQSKKPAAKDSDAVLRPLHQLIKKVENDIEGFRFNTVVSAFMNFHNQVKDEPVSIEFLKTFLVLLYPFAPHIAEELNELLGGTESLQLSKWPKHDPAFIGNDTWEIVIQVNGKVKDKFFAAANTPEKELEQQALALPKVAAALGGETPKRVIWVPGKLVNIVI